MSWLYVPGLEDWNWEFDLPSPQVSSSLLSKGKPTPRRSFVKIWRGAGWTKLLSGLMYGHLTAADGVASWISSLRATRARERAMQAVGAGPTTSSGSGMTCGESFAKWDRATSSWRTSQLTFDGVFDTFSGIFPRAGGLRNGTAFLRQPSAPLTCVTASSSLLPTPTAADHRRSGSLNYSTRSGRHGGVTLTDAIIGSLATGQRKGRLNPRFVEWMQGWPAAWTCAAINCTCAETASSPNKPPPPSVSSGTDSTNDD